MWSAECASCLLAFFDYRAGRRSVYGNIHVTVSLGKLDNSFVCVGSGDISIYVTDKGYGITPEKVSVGQ